MSEARGSMHSQAYSARRLEIFLRGALHPDAKCSMETFKVLVTCQTTSLAMPRGRAGLTVSLSDNGSSADKSSGLLRFFV